MKRQLGRQEALLLAYAQMRETRILRTGDLLGPLALSKVQERELFRRLYRGGLIARVRRGLYLVPQRLPLGGSWSPDEILALNTLIEDRGGRYQICGPNAFNRYGFDDQIPNRTYAYNNRLSGNRKIGKVELSLIEVADPRLGGTQALKTAEGLTAVYSSRVRTLVDAVYDWSRFNSLPRAYGWIKRDLAQKRVTARELVDTTVKYGNKSTIRRIGVLLEREGADLKLVRRLAKAVPKSSGLIPWIPTAAKRGTVNRRWSVVVNGDA
jgi:predicted transcriptional regulator of viral defense system